MMKDKVWLGKGDWISLLVLAVEFSQVAHAIEAGEQSIKKLVKKPGVWKNEQPSGWGLTP